MSSTQIDERPVKKRRFFVDEEEPPRRREPFFSSHVDASNSEQPVNEPTKASEAHAATLGQPDADVHTRLKASGFNAELFANIIGQDLHHETIEKVRLAANNDVERAVNIFFDGSLPTTGRSPGPAQVSPPPVAASPTTATPPVSVPQPVSSPSTTQPADVANTALTPQDTPATEAVESENNNPEWTPPEGAEVWRSMPPSRYIGAFGVGAWATKSGRGLISHGENVTIERTKLQPSTRIGRGGKLVARASQKGDVITRFTNARGEEVGRLPRETAEWVSTLVDQKICKLEGVCVYAPERIRVNDTIYLQLRCSLLDTAFVAPDFANLPDDNREVGLFEAKESDEEKDIRLRQVALVRLFDEIGLLPTSANELTVKHKKEGLLRAAEMAEQYDKSKDKNKTNNGGDSSEENDDSPELEKDQLDSLYKKAQSFDWNTPEAEPADNFVMNLRKYQKQALHWMMAKEKDVKSEKQLSMHPLWEEYTWPLKDVDDKILPAVFKQDKFYVNPYSGELSLEFPVQEQNCRGGILADEMGLGKTIEMLSLIHSHRNRPESQEPIGVNPLARLSESSSGVVSAPYTTLVVAPTSLLAQWENEALKASEPGSMNVLVYYGNERTVNLRTLCAAGNASHAPNLIVTSYGVVLSEYRQLVQNPMSYLGQIGLFSVEFFRIILDEAHVIKNRRAKSSRACYDLKAVHRWVLTGTPIVNRLEDLFSLVRFLKVEPWSNFSFWKTFITMPFESKDFVRALNVVQTVLEPLVLRRTKTMKTPEGEALVPLPPRTITIEEVELSRQEREIYDYIFTRAKQTFNDNVTAGTLLKSYTTIFAQILRLRQTCCHPSMTRNQDILAEEEDAAVAANGMNGLKDDMDLQELIDRFTSAIEQAGPDPQQDATIRFTTHALRQIQNEASGECPICTEEPMEEPAVTACWHSACKNCLDKYINHQIEKGETPRCFSCRENLNPRDVFEVIRYPSPTSTPIEDGTTSSSLPTSSQAAPRISLRRVNPLSPSLHTSSKIHALLRHLSRIPPNTKSVVFSQFTSFLDLIGPQLTRAGIDYLRLDGSTPQKTRAEIISQFTAAPETFTEAIEDEDEERPTRSSGSKRNNQPGVFGTRMSSSSPNVLLISLKAGGVGLNLTAANNVFMMDPWWSFAIEAQAIDRVHRMGQLRDVNVVRFVVKESIEGRMLRVQERKMRIAGSLGLRVGGDGNEDDKKEKIEELRMLFE